MLSARTVLAMGILAALCGSLSGCSGGAGSPGGNLAGLSPQDQASAQQIQSQVQAAIAPLNQSENYLFSQSDITALSSSGLLTDGDVAALSAVTSN